MTLPTTTSAVTYAGNGVTTQFDWTFLIPSGALEIYRTENDIAVLVDPSAYSASGLDDPNGGTVSFAQAPALGQTITIKRNVALTQDMALVTGSAFYAEVVEGAFDRATMQIQQLAEEMGRAVQVPIGSGVDPADYLDAAARSAAAAQSAASSAAGSAGAAADSVSAAATAQSGSETARDEAVAAAAAVDEAMANLGPATTTVAGISREAAIAEAASGTSTTPNALPHVTPEGVAAAIAPMGASVSTLAVSVAALATRASALENRLGYTILYPNGTESAPATVSANQRIVVVNPYGAVPCRVEVEVKISGVWGNSGHYTDGAIRAFVEAHTVDSNIIIQSGSTGVATNGSISGSPFGDWGGSNSALYRLKIWKLAGA
ncbi:MAG: hypothetical protein RBR34_08125 [Rhodospirillaceae bacterium]|nr:hypothetical protein [Rhodospirillaceae bacterium]